MAQKKPKTIMNKENKSISVRVERKTDFVKIFINDLLHVQFRAEELYSLQTWMEGKEQFWIRYYLKSGVMNCYYYNQDLWKSIITELNKISLV